MTRSRLLVLLLAVPLTVAGYIVALVVTRFLACGLSGCGGGGFGPSYGPVEAQVGMQTAGLVLLPVTLFLLHGWPRLAQAAGGAAAVLAGALLAMVLLDLGPDGCPAAQTRATAGPNALSPGEPTCSGDDDALP